MIQKANVPERSFSKNWTENANLNESNPISDEIERIVYVDEYLCFKCCESTAGIGVEVIWPNGNYLAVICGHCGGNG